MTNTQTDARLRILAAAAGLIAEAGQAGLVVTIATTPKFPLAMGNYKFAIGVRDKRGALTPALPEVHEVDFSPIACPSSETPGVAAGALAEREVKDAIRSAYDLGYNDARGMRAVTGDGAPGYRGQQVEKDHGGALLARLRAIPVADPPAEAVRNTMLSAVAKGAARRTDELTALVHQLTEALEHHVEQTRPIERSTQALAASKAGVADQPAEPSPAARISVDRDPQTGAYLLGRRDLLTAPAQVDPLDALRWGANVAETLLSIGRAIGFGRAQQMLGEQWEAEHNCAPRGRMGVTVKDAPAEAESLPVGSIRTWHKNGRQHLEWVDALDGCDALLDGEHELYAAPVPEFLASHALSELVSLGYTIDGDDLRPPMGSKEWDDLVAARWAAPKGDSNG